VIIYTKSIIVLQIIFGWWNWWGILVKVHVGYMVETSSWWVGTYMRCIVDDLGIYGWVVVYVYLIHDWYILMCHSWWLLDSWFIHTWYMVGFTCLWCMVQVISTCYLVQVDWYRFTTVYLIVIVWQWFHHYTSTSGCLDGARTCGCSHLPVVVREHRGLHPPSGCS